MIRISLIRDFYFITSPTKGLKSMFIKKMKASLIFPHQLFQDTAHLKDVNHAYLFEDPLFFSQVKFHKQKLLLHRASMKAYAEWLNIQDVACTYIEHKSTGSLEVLFERMKSDQVEKLHVVLPDDYLLQRRMNRFSKDYNIPVIFFENPMFILNQQQVHTYIEGKSAFFMGSFYKDQRKSLGILMEGNAPMGGKWSFDEENRKKLPRSIKLPAIGEADKTSYLDEASEYVNTHFEDNPGDTENFIYPVTFEQAQQWLQTFLHERLNKFGDYEDAISSDDEIIFHSVLSPSINIGLITPRQVIDETMEYATRHDVPLNSLEGFIRQIIGWREYMRIVYHARGNHQRTCNHFGHTREIPEAFYKAETGIEPVDQTIRKLLKTSYNHHIERLMVLGNFMLLCEFDPDAIYRWFMELYIDAYDWVMVPNVYAMSQYADNGEITTKPYISGSNYIRKMSNYKSGPWCEIWDGLYWRFLHNHKDEFKSNPRMSMMIRMLDKMDTPKLNMHLKNANEFLNSLN